MIYFHCSGCKYKVSAPEDEAGEMMLCPSCFTTLRIPPPNTSVAIEKAEQAGSVFELRQDGISKVYDANIPVYCRLCHTLMYADESQVGTNLMCPDCGTQTPVLSVVK